MIRYNRADFQTAATVNFWGKQGLVWMIAARLRNCPLDSLDRISKRDSAAQNQQASDSADLDSTDLTVGFLRERLGIPDWLDQSGRYGLISVPRED